MAKYPRCESDTCDRIATASIWANDLFDSDTETYHSESSMLCFECAAEYVKHWSPEYMTGYTEGRRWCITITQIVGEE